MKSNQNKIAKELKYLINKLGKRGFISLRLWKRIIIINYLICLCIVMYIVIAKKYRNNLNGLYRYSIEEKNDYTLAFKIYHLRSDTIKLKNIVLQLSPSLINSFGIDTLTIKAIRAVKNISIPAFTDQDFSLCPYKKHFGTFEGKCLFFNKISKEGWYEFNIEFSENISQFTSVIPKRELLNSIILTDKNNCIYECVKEGVNYEFKGVFPYSLYLFIKPTISILFILFILLFSFTSFILFFYIKNIT